MRKLLLTSSQVSVLISAVIIISCTVALFLSGYAIQQRTLRDLRTAIKPRAPRPKTQFYLPEQFRVPSQLENGDGSAVETTIEVPDAPTEEQPPAVVEVAQSTSEEEVVEEEETRSRETVSAEKIAIVDQLMAQVAQKSWAVEHPDPLVKSKVPITKAERRQLIRDEIQRLSRADEPVYYQRRLW